MKISVEFKILAHLLVTGQDYGLRMSKQIPVALGSVYVTLGRMEKEGLVVDSIDMSSLPAKRIYSLTKLGERKAKMATEVVSWYVSEKTHTSKESSLYKYIA